MSMMKFLQQYNCYNFVFIISDLTGYYINNNLPRVSFSDGPCTSATGHYFDFQMIGDFANMLPPRILLKPSDDCLVTDL